MDRLYHFAVQTMFAGEAAFCARGKPGSFDITGTSSVTADLAGMRQVCEHFYQRWILFDRDRGGAG